ncbi:hypothetical protein CC658_05205 [Salmonella enterica subsp. enterica serovar Koketime]|uniref:Uncharacterized protein n=2 Tax=Salmonella enterica TaxID=28901 RepID=A0A749RZF8_SALER|nr:hypothetical protein [Salmonella enterica subsp. enterica serovar Koketime]EAM8929003.1 hypothetical protein [Salmonella enterica]EBB4439568.1 hypothetical protein [Salmonella enterica]EBR9060059.1 hypothetical protein [Salmonella enterica subsp. enterica serovar Koketime]EBV0082867.1 hypothetical protein [Salmonella enterica subsp. enterica serovar Koketime]
MLSKTGFTHSDLLCWQIDYAGGSLNVNGTIMRDTYIFSSILQQSISFKIPLQDPYEATAVKLFCYQRCEMGVAKECELVS